MRWIDGCVDLGVLRGYTSGTKGRSILHRARRRAPAGRTKEGPSVTWDDDPDDAWDPETKSFDGLRLHRFMIRGEWTIDRLAAATGCAPSTLRNARNGRPVTDATAGAIIRALREPYRSAA
jgi:hypothetical protein